MSPKGSWSRANAQVKSLFIRVSDPKPTSAGGALSKKLSAHQPWCQDHLLPVLGTGEAADLPSSQGLGKTLTCSSPHF